MTPSVGPIERFMTEDHVRIDRLLEASERSAGAFDEERYDQFRGALLRHIAMEEKVLLQYARIKRGGIPLPIASKLREDHGRLAKLLVRSPTAQGVASVREELARHDALEEGPHGLYALVDEMAAHDAPAIVERLRNQPAVPLARYYDGPLHHKS